MGGIGRAASQRAISRSTLVRDSPVGSAKRCGSKVRTTTPLARPRRICSRRLRVLRKVSTQVTGSQSACSPIRMAAKGAAVANRSSVPKKQARRRCAAAAATNLCATAGARSDRAIGAPAATQAWPVSR